MYDVFPQLNAIVVCVYCQQFNKTSLVVEYISTGLTFIDVCVYLCVSHTQKCPFISCAEMSYVTHDTQVYCHMYVHVHVRVKLQDGVVWQRRLGRAAGLL